MAKSTVSGKAFDLNILRRVYAFTRPYRKKFYLSVFLTLAIAGIAPLRPILIQQTIDKAISTGSIFELKKMLLLMVGLLLVQTIIQYVHTYLTNWLGQTVIRDLRVQLFRHITSLRSRYFDQTPIGTLVTRTISDLETIADIFSEGLIVIMGDLLQLIVIIVVMFFIDWRLTLVGLSTIPILLVATRIFQYGINITFREVRTQVTALNTFVQEHITGMSIVQIFNREEEEMKRFTAINREHMNANIKSVWYYAIFFPVVELLSNTSIGLIVWWGSHGVIIHEVSVGNIISFNIFIGMLFRPIRELADKFNTLQMGMVSSERVLKVLDTAEFIPNTGTVKKEIKGAIRFEKVWFAYSSEVLIETGEPDWVIRDLSFEIKPGETLALIGATGAGKSSVINLVGRMYEFQKGRIYIDDIDIREYELDNLRRQLAVVLQDVFLFSDTILNNITLKNSSISEETVVEAAKQVGADEFIRRLPEAYNFNVMERGAMLSVGQRQLLSFIRAFVYNPSILVLDEATSSIDSESEELIQKATAKLTSGRTSIVIAHRLATIQNADKIIVMHLGRKEEEGTHQELLRAGGKYKMLYELQFQDEI